MANAVPGRQQAVLDYVVRTYTETGVPPAVRDVTAALGLSGPSIAWYHLGQLVRDGKLRKVRRTYIPAETPIAGTVRGDLSRASCPWGDTAHNFYTLYDFPILYCRKCGVSRTIDVAA